MANSKETYTYPAGKKVTLGKSDDQIVVRALPDRLDDVAITHSEQVLSVSTRLTTDAADLEPLMERNRGIAPTLNAYCESETGAEFLITDSVLVSFKDMLSDAEVDEFAGRYGLIKKCRSIVLKAKNYFTTGSPKLPMIRMEFTWIELRVATFGTNRVKSTSI